MTYLGHMGYMSYIRSIWRGGGMTGTRVISMSCLRMGL
jgi:hypothetical protein